MRYLLVAGFECDIYRREPRARLFFNEKLIDEFNIAHQIRKNFIDPLDNLTHPLEPCVLKIWDEYIKNKLTTLRFYSIDVDDRLEKVSLRIDIDNDDSNHTNGFLTKSTKLQCNLLSLLPVERKIYECFSLKTRNQRFTEKYAWYQKKKINVFFSLLNGLTWVGTNGKKIDEVMEWFFGGSGYFHCEVNKKYGILLGKIHYPEYAYLYSAKALLHQILYDKYEQYENQRNSN